MKDISAIREELGQLVRQAWVQWALTQPNPKPSWLVPYGRLDEPDKEADRQIGEAVARWVLASADLYREAAIARVKLVADEQVKGMSDALRMAEAAAGEWQPIETAPKDGTLIIAYRPKGNKYIRNVSQDYWMITETGRGVWAKSNSYREPTHWHPLPAPPKNGVLRGSNEPVTVAQTPLNGADT